MRTISTNTCSSVSDLARSGPPFISSPEADSGHHIVSSPRARGRLPCLAGRRVCCGRVRRHQRLIPTTALRGTTASFSRIYRSSKVLLRGILTPSPPPLRTNMPHRRRGCRFSNASSAQHPGRPSSPCPPHTIATSPRPQPQSPIE